MNFQTSLAMVVSHHSAQFTSAAAALPCSLTFNRYGPQLSAVSRLEEQAGNPRGSNFAAVSCIGYIIGSTQLVQILFHVLERGRPKISDTVGRTEWSTPWLPRSQRDMVTLQAIPEGVARYVDHAFHAKTCKHKLNSGRVPVQSSLNLFPG
jgi:hypothetical protein